MRDFTRCLVLTVVLLTGPGASAEVTGPADASTRADSALTPAEGPTRPSMMGGQRGPGKVGLDDGGALSGQANKLALALGKVSPRLRQIEPSTGAWDQQCEHRAAETKPQQASNDARGAQAAQCVEQGRRLYKEGRGIEERCNRVFSASTADVRTGSPAAQRRIMMVVDACTRQLSAFQSKLDKHELLVRAVGAP